MGENVSELMAGYSTRRSGSDMEEYLKVPPGRRRAAVALASIVAVAACGTSTIAEPVTVTYLANEGFHVATESGSVLIDALFGPGLSGYPAVPLEIRSALESGQGRFANVDCVLVSHEHADHFDPHATARFLAARPVQLVSTETVVAQLAPLLPSFAGPAPIGRYPPPRHRIEEISCGGARVSLLRLGHGRLPVQNLGFLIDLDGFTLLHVGDAEVSRERIRAFDLARRGVDLAFLPVWHLADSRWMPVVAEIAPRHIVAMHLPRADAPASWFGSAGSLDGQVAAVQRAFPRAWIPREPLEWRGFDRLAGGSRGAARIPAGN
jgi:L-ascorbate metabolism protein UlaG (beta-lactamase superfamily)